MKRLSAAIAVAVAALTVGVGSASAASPHLCRVADEGSLHASGSITASGYTSCEFARAVLHDYDNRSPWNRHAKRMRVWSSVTGDTYGVTCRIPYGFMNGDEVSCSSSGTDSWTRFYFWPDRSRHRYMALSTIGMPSCNGEPARHGHARAPGRPGVQRQINT